VRRLDSSKLGLLCGQNMDQCVDYFDQALAVCLQFKHGSGFLFGREGGWHHLQCKVEFIVTCSQGFIVVQWCLWWCSGCRSRRVVRGGLRRCKSHCGVGNQRINNRHRSGRRGRGIVIGSSCRGRLIRCCCGVLRQCHHGRH